MVCTCFLIFRAQAYFFQDEDLQREASISTSKKRFRKGASSHHTKDLQEFAPAPDDPFESGSEHDGEMFIFMNPLYLLFPSFSY